MEVRNLCIFFKLIFVTIVMILSGCASNHVNLVDKGTLSIEYLPSTEIYISRVHVNQDGNDLVITGRVKRRYFSPIGSGHVDIAIISPEGEILERVSTYYIPRIIPRKPGLRGHRGSHFEVQLPAIPPEGSKVRLAYHRTEKSVSRTFNCGENAAFKK